MAGLVSRVGFEGLCMFELWPCPFFIGDPYLASYFIYLCLPFVSVCMPRPRVAITRGFSLIYSSVWPVKIGPQ